MASCITGLSVPVSRQVAKPAVSCAGLTKTALPAAKVAKKATFVSNGAKWRQMLVWQPVNNKYFETLSYLPPLSEDAIAKQVDYIVNNGWTPCLEFADTDHAYVSSASCVRLGNVSANYVDNRYWTMFKLPMFGCTDASQVLGEVRECSEKFPDAYVRLVAFDAVRQVQCAMVLVHRPASSPEYRPVEERSV